LGGVRYKQVLKRLARLITNDCQEKSLFPLAVRKGFFVKFYAKALYSPPSGNDDDHKNHKKDV